MNNSAVGALSEMDYAVKMLNLQDTFGMTPMHIAAINFDLGIFSFLIQMNPNDEIKDSIDKTFIDYLKENEDIDQKLLKSLII
jgi:ankyrin repeat protein